MWDSVVNSSVFKTKISKNIPTNSNNFIVQYLLILPSTILLQLCMVLIKVSDISNEARPMDVAEPWLDRLLQEFFKQSDAEKLEGLPVTPFMDREKITKPSSQCSFIGFVLLPLFEALGDLFPELQVSKKGT